MTTLQDALRNTLPSELDGTPLKTDGAQAESNTPPAESQRSATRASKPRVVKGGKAADRPNVIHHHWINRLYDKVAALFESHTTKARKVESRGKDGKVTESEAKVAAYKPLPTNVDVYATLPTTGAMRNPEGIQTAVLVPPTYSSDRIIFRGKRMLRTLTKQRKATEVKVSDRWKIGINVQKYTSAVSSVARDTFSIAEALLVQVITIYHGNTQNNIGRTADWQSTMTLFGFSAAAKGGWTRPDLNLQHDIRKALRKIAEECGPVPKDLLIDYLAAATVRSRDQRNVQTFAEVHAPDGACPDVKDPNGALDANGKVKMVACPFMAGKVRLSLTQAALLRAIGKPLNWKCPAHGTLLVSMGQQTSKKTRESKPRVAQAS